MTASKTQKLIQALPKVELHLHLEGAIPLNTLWQLVEKYGGTSELGDLAQLEQKFAYKDFAHFIDTWIWKNNFLREYEDFTLIAAAVAEDLTNQNVRYAEVFYSPGDFARHGLEVQELTAAIRRGLNTQPEITINLVADLIRDFGPEQGAIWLQAVSEVKELGVIGIGIGGSEQAFPPEPYAAVFETARNFGFKTSAHAGEAAGPESIWGAVKTLQVDRIGHGTRAIEDPSLVNWLQTQQIPIEACPISNLRTGVVPNLAAHPIRQFYAQNLLVSVNTDDPKMFNTSLEEEYLALMSTFGFQFPDIIRFSENAIQSAWCSADFQQKLMGELHNFVALAQTTESTSSNA
ncbi:adenosine deaminase [Leptolyngbya sp. FACHB-261]|uniref:adenosine deaminase n=1 Tax=Leptolyngbya sp. FACHB-261 TaxID=2692806 RepID=UPI001682E0F7|nr:adenosine deaminase [Leptolyngbya sp. FACHB-261]MBD2103283.1 adenosine deaminase [Leptolyngbya sp. FACHB-261]